ncbi:MAG: toll/interleukin-1 receptor domain-containing protein, partial [Acidobacteria bacterium]|nr:toll/interleukin-1 receptor domain-containing protein [Acidobacteriota bacterium]
MPYDHDLFISYAHLDNESLDDSDRGWVDLLHKRLTIRLAQLLGDEPKIWRDLKLSGNDVFGETLLIKLYGAALLLSVLSPRYLKSEWCRRELNTFHNRALQGGGVTIGDKHKIFKVIKTPISREDHPEILRGTSGYEFYEINPTSGRFREFGHDSSFNRDRRYWELLEDLAQDIKDLIESIREQKGVHPPLPIQHSGKTIFLAETTSDLCDQYLRVRRELQLNGHRVLPERPLAHTRKFRDEVNGLLSECQLTVHLVGETYAAVPEGESESIIQLQHRLATGLPQIVWMPAGLTSTDERQQRFINTLLDQSDDLSQDKLEDLKDFIHAKLNPSKLQPEPKSPANVNGSHNPKLIYLVCDQLDYSMAAPIEDFLFARGYEVLSLAGGADQQMHIDNLLLCDAMLTFCGRTTDAWLQKKKSDLIKLPGYGRTKPMLAKGFYIGAPRSELRDRFRIQDGVVMRNYGDFTPASLE